MSGSSNFPMILSGMAQSVPDVFANQLRISVTVTDFTLVFGTGDGGNISGQSIASIRDRVAVHLSPGMIKQLLVNIQMVVDAYEAAIGQIPIPARTGATMIAHKESLIASLREQMTEVPDQKLTKPE